MGVANSYTDEEILEGLHAHMVDNLKSKYSMHNPMTWQGILKRMDKSEDLTSKVNSIENEALSAWEDVGLKALKGEADSFNTALYKMFVVNKRSFLSAETLDLEERIQVIENGNNSKS